MIASSVNMSLVAVDSQVYSYLISVWVPDGPDAADPLKDEKLALVWTFFYCPETFYIPPTVTHEYQQIQDTAKRTAHEDFVLVAPLNPVNQQEVDRLTLHYQQFHPGPKNQSDCRIVAEAESCGCGILLTFDSTLRTRVNGKTNTIEIIAPSEYWGRLAIPRGSRPNKVPHSTNPLVTKTWWKW